MRQALADRGFEVAVNTPTEFAAMIAADYEKYRKLIVEADIKPQ